MVSGLGSFVIGINPFLAAIVLPNLAIEGPSLLKFAVVGILVYCVSLSYYNATDGRWDDGMLRL